MYKKYQNEIIEVMCELYVSDKGKIFIEATTAKLTECLDKMYTK